MLVDQSTHRREILEKILQDHGYANIFVTCGLDDLYSLVTMVSPDVVLIELESPSRDTLEQLRAIRKAQPTPVVMFAQDQDVQTVHAAVDSGVCAYMCDRVDRGSVQPAIALAMATFAAYRKVRKEADGYRLELDWRKQLDHAKSILIREHQISEEEAHRMLRKIAMDENRKLRHVVEDLVRSSSI